jgi:hypothetical protein
MEFVSIKCPTSRRIPHLCRMVNDGQQAQAECRWVMDVPLLGGCVECSRSEGNPLYGRALTDCCKLHCLLTNL